MKAKYTTRLYTAALALITVLVFVAPRYSTAQPSRKPQTNTSALTFPGSQKPLIRGSFMPYVAATVGNAEGLLQLDFGSTYSTIDVKKFKGGIIPKPIGSDNTRFELDNLFGPENKEVNLSLQSYSIRLPGQLVQAGIIGTDILCERVFTLDYINNLVYSSPKVDFYSENSLREKGFSSISTVGYYAKDSNKLDNKCVANVPTVPIRIGAAIAVAQIDPGYDDKLYRHAVNINKTFFNALKAAGVSLVRAPERDIQLTTCVGSPEKITGYTLGPGQSFEILGTDGKAAFITSDISLFLKDTPLEAKSCGGIGSWQIPAAQLGASFLIDAQQVIFDPFASIVWFKGK
jgi:hypothetical protein